MFQWNSNNPFLNKCILHFAHYTVVPSTAVGQPPAGGVQIPASAMRGMWRSSGHGQVRSSHAARGQLPYSLLAPREPFFEGEGRGVGEESSGRIQRIPITCFSRWKKCRLAIGAEDDLARTAAPWNSLGSPAIDLWQGLFAFLLCKPVSHGMHMSRHHLVLNEQLICSFDRLVVII